MPEKIASRPVTNYDNKKKKRFEQREDHNSEDSDLDRADHFFQTGVDYSSRTIYLGTVNFDTEGNDLGIESRMAEYFIKGIHLLNEQSSLPVRALLNSPGGNITDGLAIFDAIRSSKAPVDIEVYGSAMSMAAIILQAGRKRLVHPNVTIMIHDGYTKDVERITARASENWARWSIEDRVRTYEIFAERTGKNIKYWKKVSNHDQVYMPKEALKVGLIDGIIKPAEWTKNLSN